MADSSNSSPSPPKTPQSPRRRESITSINRTSIESPSFLMQSNAAVDENEANGEHYDHLILSPSFYTPLSFDYRVDETERLYTNERSIHQIPIYIETLTGTTFEMQIMSEETIYAVKYKLQLEEGIPASQQHLLWQGEELKDEFTLEEYGIGFGAILRLVLGMRGGPLSESPLATANSKETMNDQREITAESQPLTVLIFQNGDHIRLLTIGTGNTTASLRTGEFGAASSSFETAAGSTSMHRQESESRNETVKSARRKKSKTERDIENEALRIKMDELKKKMKCLSIKKKQTKDAGKKSESNKLPSITDSKKIAQCSKSKIEKQAPIHFPSIVPSKSKSAKRSANSVNGNEELAEDAIEKPECVANITSRYGRMRSTSLSPKNSFITPDQCVSVNEIKSKPLFYRVSSPQTAAEGKEETSLCGSIAVIKLENRPQTTPRVGRINEIRKMPNFKEFQALAKSRSRRTSAVKARKATESKLPPVVDQKRVRCFQCKKRLGLAMRYQCRCGSTFCASHRYSETHNCSFDYRQEGKNILQINNPPVRASKLPKI